MQTKIIYEDDHVLVCHKPAGLATQSGRVGLPDVVSELKKYLNMKPPYLGIVHRLDQPVEGLLVFAKTQKAAAHLTKQLTQGSLNKQYYAVVCGKPVAESGELVDYLVKDGSVARVADAQAEGAKKAVLRYKVVGELKEDLVNTLETEAGEKMPVYILDVHIDTGRFHQIRVQLSHAGLPIVSDNKYGTSQALEVGRKLGFRNVALFAYKIEFTHPTTQKKLTFSIQPELLHEK